MRNIYELSIYLSRTQSIPLHINFHAYEFRGLTQGAKGKLTFAILAQAEMLTRQQKHTHFINPASLTGHQLLHVIAVAAKQLKIKGPTIAARGSVFDLTIPTSFLAIPALGIHLLKIKLEGCDHVFVISSPLLPSTCFHSQLLHSLFKLNVFLVNTLHLSFFFTQFLKNSFLHK